MCTTAKVSCVECGLRQAHALTALHVAGGIVVFEIEDTFLHRVTVSDRPGDHSCSHRSQD